MLFYLFAIPALLFEITALYGLKKLYKMRDEMKGKKYDDMTTKQQALCIGGLFYTLWVFCGLFTSQWLLFIVFILLSMIPKKAVLILGYVDAVLTIFLLFFIVINKYHLHIEMNAILHWFFNLFAGV